MPAVQDQPFKDPAHRVPACSVDSYHESATPDADIDLRHQQIAHHLLRELEARRLPDVLALRDQVREGERLLTEERERLAELMRMLDQSADLLPDDAELPRVRQDVARLCDEILTHAHANERTEPVTDQAQRQAGDGGF